MKNDIELTTILSDFNLKNLNEIKDKNENYIYQSIKNLIEKINWNLDQSQQIQSLDTAHKSCNILISYKKNKDFSLCVRIKEKLELSGFSIVFSENDVLSLEEITKPVEMCQCMIMCITEKYRQSINCQLEAKYAYKLNKKIIPIIMQSDVHGWLDAMIDEKLAIDFAKYEFDACIQKLKVELKKS